ncbi:MULTISPECIES: metal-dependent hydrolase [Cohnella]|uniref:metal-dependent hydrolase n=1 Tax=Cohnella TaxID=329857 RepID=UPI0009BB41FB|nr:MULTISPECIES: metal-dependent hydrolase [Cohnella]MBN2983108.1 metal-dependent hydrolase [Cohnella algarum]
MELIYHGHSCLQIVTEGKSIVIDPFLRGNELAVTKPEDIKADYVLLTHAHTDHILDAEPIAKTNGAPVVAAVELADYMSGKGLKTIGMNIGGTIDLGFAKATMVQAVHSSGIQLEGDKAIYGGLAAGYMIRAEGLTILHTGDTALFGDMQLIGKRHKPDAVFLPIGDHFTMGPDDALQAAEWFGASWTVPVHYNTFAPIRQDAEAFVKRLGEIGLKGKVLAPGESFVLPA